MNWACNYYGTLTTVYDLDASGARTTDAALIKGREWVFTITNYRDGKMKIDPVIY
jgi:hypothetical protein